MIILVIILTGTVAETVETKSKLQECIEEEMAYWEDITLSQAKELCRYLISND
jgi:hypothetical protein